MTRYRYILFMAALVAAFLCAPAVVRPADAHGWYSEKKDPVFRHSCCGGTDCAMWAIQPGQIDAVEAGYHVRLTLDESRKINPYSMAPIDGVVTWDRVQPSLDGNWHLCVMTSARDPARAGIYCLFAPPDT